MDFQKKLELGVEKGIITPEQKESLINLFKDDDKNEIANTSGVVKLMYYIGGFIMLCAMSVLMSHTIQHGTYAKILILGVIYAALFFIIAEYLWKKAEKFPSAILYFLFITMISFIITDITKMTGFFPHFSDFSKYGNFYEACRPAILTIAILTIIISSILLKYRKTSFLIVPVITSAFSIYMIIAEMIFGQNVFKTENLASVGMIFSLALIGFGFISDKRTKADYSLWLYFIGALGLFECYIICLGTFRFEDNIFELLLLLLSLIYLLIGFLIRRKVFTVIGILGIIQYIFYLEFTLIKGNITLLTSTIIATGLLILYAGVVYARQVDNISAKLENLLPEKIKNYLPQNREE